MCPEAVQPCNGTLHVCARPLKSCSRALHCCNGVVHHFRGEVHEGAYNRLPCAEASITFASLEIRVSSFLPAMIHPLIVRW